MLFAIWFIKTSIGTSAGGSDMLRRARLSYSENTLKNAPLKETTERLTLLLVAESPALHLCKRLNNARCDEASRAISDLDWRTNRKRSATEDHVSAARDCFEILEISIFTIDYHINVLTVRASGSKESTSSAKDGHSSFQTMRVAAFSLSSSTTGSLSLLGDTPLRRNFFRASKSHNFMASNA